MRIRNIILIVFPVLTLLSAGGFWFISRNVLLREYQQIENKEITNRLEQARSAIELQKKSLLSLAADWGAWDEPTQYASKPNQEFIDRNLSYDSLATADIDLIAIYSTSGQLLTSSQINTSDNSLVPLNQSVRDYVNKYPKSIIFSGLQDTRVGLIFDNSTPIVTAFVPLVGTNRSGPITGTLLVGRILNDTRLEELKNSLLFDVSINQTPAVIPPGIEYTPDTISAYSSLPDLSGTNNYQLRVNSPREVTNQGLRTINTFLLTVVAVNLTIIVAGVLVANRLVVNQVLFLIDRVKEITDKQSFGQKLTVHPFVPFEIKQLYLTINRLLVTIQALNQQQDQQSQQLKNQLELVNAKNAENENIKRAILNILEDQKELDDKLKSEQYRLNSIINSMGEGLLVIDSDYNVQIINPSACLLLETNPAEAVGQNWSELITAIETDQVISTPNRSFSQVISTGISKITTSKDNHYYQTKSGRKFPVAATTTPLKNQSGEVIGAIKIFRDVSQEKHEREVIEKAVSDRTRELNSEKARLSATLNSLSQGFILLDMSGQTILANPALLRLLQKTVSPAQAKEFIQLLPNPKLAENLLRKSILGEGGQIPESILHDRTVNTVFIPVVIASETDRRQIGVAVLVEDITEEKLLERSRDEFFSIASHELRTPLTAIRGNTSMILDYFQDQLNDPQLKEMITDIHTSSIRLIGIVGDFLDLSRLEQGRLELKREAVDLSKLVLETIDELQPAAVAKSLHLSGPEYSSGFILRSDSNRIKQMLINLIDNAIKYTPQGNITVTLKHELNNYHIEVADTGRGIPQSQQQLLFRKFQQTGQNIYTRDATKGTGLGLYISKLLAESLGGNIQLIKSAENAGSVFSITLPAE